MAWLFCLLFPCRLAADGPGLGNFTYAPEEVLSTVARFEKTTGAPYGHGIVTMHKGYLVVPFALDAGGGRDSGGFAFYDVSNPRSVQLTYTTSENPAHVENGPNDAGALGEPHGYSFTRFGGKDYVCFTQNRYMPNASGLQVWDFTEMDVPAPTRVSQIGLPGLSGGDYSPRAWWVCWQGGRYAYVAGGSGGLFVVDLTDPANPVLIASRSTSQLGFGNKATNVVFAVGNLLVVTGSQPLTNNTATGLATYDISDPANPILLDHESDLAGYSSMVNGNRIYGARDPAHVWSIADPAHITLLGIGPDVAGKGGYGTVQDDRFLYGSSNRYVKLNTTTTPFSVDQMNAPLGFTDPDWDFAVALGNLVFQGNDHSGSALVVQQAEPDTTPPAVNMVSPAPDSLLQALTSRVGLTFTDSLDLGTVDSSTVIVRPIGGGALPGRYSHQTGIVNFWPDQALEPDTTYEIHLPAGGVKDFAGNALAAPYTSRFSTGDSLVTISVAAEGIGPVQLGESASFTAAGTGPGTLEYSWDFGDGSEPTAFSPETSVSHSYTAPGHYAVTVKITNGVINNNASLTQAVYRPATPVSPANASTIFYNPADHHVWSVNPDAGTVTVLDAASLTKLSEIPVGRHPRTLALSPAGDMWVLSQDDASISVLDAGGTGVLRTIDLPRASRPYGIAFSPDGSAAWVTTEGTGQVLKLDPLAGGILGSVAPGGSLRGIAISGDSARVFVSRFISGDSSGEVHEIDPATLTVLRSIPLIPDPGPDTEASGRGLPNYLSSIAISPDGADLWIPSKKDNIQRGLSRDGQALTFESTVRTIVSRIDLSSNSEDPATRVDFNDRDMANAVAFSPLGDYAFVALQGSNAVDVLDAYSGELVAALENVGRAPQGIAVDPSGTRLFVQNFMDRSIAVYDTSLLAASISSGVTRLASISTVESEPLAADVLAGKRIFYDATDRRMNHDGYISCASCHLDGGHDGRTWDFSDRGEGLRNTITLHGRSGMGHGRVHWSGNFDEIQDFENDIRNAFGGSGFLTDAQFLGGTRQQPLGDPKAGLSPELDALAAYVASLDSVDPSPYRNPDGGLTAAAIAGHKHFGQLGCYACHSGNKFTDSNAGLSHDVGTLKLASGPLAGLDTPTLKGVWETAPYLHDGSAASLSDVLSSANPAGYHGAAQLLSPTEQGELAQYLRELDETDGTYDFGPLLQMTEPVAGALYAVGGAIPLAVHVPDLLGGVEKVEFFRDGLKLGEDDTAPFEWSYGGATEREQVFQARVHLNSGPKSSAVPVKVSASPAIPLPSIHVNFQPATAAVPPGYLVDSGAVFGDRGNGYSYGWNAPNAVTRDRNSNLSPDQRYDTFNHMQNAANPDASWEIAVPDGVYQVHIVAGEAIFDAEPYRIAAEGVLVVNGTPTTSHRWVEGTLEVTVNDGRLSVRNAPGAEDNKICFIDILPSGTTNNGTTVSLQAFTSNTAEGSDEPAMIRLTRSGSTTVPMEVKLAGSGTAQAGADFTPVAGTKTIPAGAGTLDIPITAIADQAAEGPESVTLSLLPAATYAAGPISTATVTISDRPFDHWRFSRFRPLERIEGTVSGFEADPFAKGVSNGLAYALGLEPGSAIRSALPRGIDDEGHFALMFTRPVGVEGVGYQVESSTSLESVWEAMGWEKITIVPNGDGTETVIAREPADHGDGGRIFLRLRVSPE